MSCPNPPPYLPTSVSLCLYLYLHLFTPVSPVLSVSDSLSPSLSVSGSPTFYVSVSLRLSMCPCVSLFQRFSLCLSLTSLYLSETLRPSHLYLSLRLSVVVTRASREPQNSGSTGRGHLRCVVPCASYFLITS